MSPWNTADISLVEAYGDVGTPYGEIETVFHLDDFGPMFGTDQDADLLYDSTIGQLILGVPADVGANEPILNIVPHTAGTTPSADPATPLDATHPTVAIWDSGVTDVMAFYNDDTLSHILSEVAGGVEVDIGLWLGDATGDQAKLRIYGYDETAAGAAYYTIGTHDDANNLLSLQIGLLTTTAATENLVVCARGDTPALNVAPLNTIAHPKFSVWGATAGVGDWLVMYNDDTDSWIRTGAGGIFFDAVAAGDGVDIRFYPEGTPVIDIGADIFVTGIFIDIGYDTAESSTGNLTVFRFTNAAALTLGGDLLGMDLDFSTLVTVATDRDITGYNLTLPAITQSAANTTTYIGYQIDTAGALVQDTAAGTLNQYGINLVAPQSTISFAASTITTAMFRVGTAGALASSTSGTHNWYVADIVTPASTTTDTATTTIAGFRIGTAGAVEINTGAGATNWRGTDIQLPAVTQTTGTITAYGHQATLGDITTGGTVAGYNLITPAKTNSTANTLTFRGFYTSSVGALIQDTAAGILNWYGFDLTAPASTLSFAAGAINTVIVRLATANPVASSTAGTHTWYLVDAITPTVTVTGTATTTVAGFRLATAGALSQSTAAGTINWYGTDIVTPVATAATALAATINVVGNRLATAGALTTTDAGNVLNWTGQEIQMPNMTETGGTLTVVGLDIDAGTVTSGTVTGINIAMEAAYSGTQIAQVITGDNRTLQLMTTDGHIIAPSEDLIIQGNVASSVYDVLFFGGQSDPGSGVMAAGEVPRITISGWDHTASSPRSYSIGVISVEEGANPDDNELPVLRLLTNNTIHGIFIHDAGLGATSPELTAAFSHPTLRIYDSGGTDYIQFYDDDSFSWVVGNPNPINIAPSNDVDNYIRFSTASNVPGFASIAADMDIQNLAGTSGVIYDVTFFANQSDPGTGVLPAGSVPELRIYGWDHTDTALRYTTLRTSSVAETVNPDDDEHSFFMIGLDPAGSRRMVICDADETIIEFAGDTANPTLFIYDGGATDYLGFYDNDAASWIVANPNPINISPSNDLDDYIQFDTKSSVPGFTTIGDVDLSIQNQAAANPFDVMFFASQTVPAATPAAGSTPELRIYGWSSATINTQVYSAIWTGAVPETHAETNDEIGVMHIQPANNYLLITDQDVGVGMPEITAAAASPTIRLYDGAATPADYIEIYQQDADPAIISSTQALDLFLNGNTGDYIRFSTITNVPGIGTRGNTDLGIMNLAVVNPFDVTFFANQTDPASAAMAAGEVPEIRIYGWDHADTALRYTALRTSSVAETVDPTDDEHSFFMIGLDPAGSRRIVICEADETTIEFTAVVSNPTLSIYDAGATDRMSFQETGTYASFQTNANPIYLLPATGVVRFRHVSDTDDTLYLEISTPNDGTYVQLIESGNSLMTQMLVLGFVDSRPTVSGTHGAEIHGFTGVGAGAAGKGRLTTGAGTISYCTITGATDETNHITLGFDVPDFAIDTGVAADFTIEIEFDPAADGDKFDVALLNSVYGFIGTQTITASGAAKQWSTVFNVGALSDTGTIAKGDSLILYLTFFSDSARTSGANCDIYRIRIRSTVGIEIDTA